MLATQVLNRSVNRIFILGIIKEIQVLQTNQEPLYYLMVETQESWKDKIGNAKTIVERHYVVLDQKFAEDFKKLLPEQLFMVQGQLRNKQINQFPQLKCMSYIQAVNIIDLNNLLDLDEIEDNDGLPFPKQFVSSLWS